MTYSKRQFRQSFKNTTIKCRHPYVQNVQTDENTRSRHRKTLGGNCFYSNSRDSQSDSNVRKNSAANPNVGQQRHLVVQGQGEIWSHSFGNLLHTLVAQQWIACFEICFYIQTVLWCSYQQLEYKLCNGSKRFETAGVGHTHGMNKLCIYNKFVAQRCKNIHVSIIFLKFLYFLKYHIKYHIVQDGGIRIQHFTSLSEWEGAEMESCCLLLALKRKCRLSV